MANTVYDPEQKREKNSGSPDLGPGQNQAAGDPSDPRGANTTGATSSTGGRSAYNTPTVPKSDLRTAEESPNNPSNSGSEEGKGGGGFYNPGGDQAGKSQGGSTNSTKSSSPSSLKDAESSTSQKSDDGLYNPEGEAGRSRYFNRTRNATQRIRNASRGRKLLIAGALGSSGFMIFMIIFVLLAIGGYKVVNFAEHVAVYQFARSTRQAAEATTAITEEKIAYNTITDDSLRNRLKTAYVYQQGILQAKSNEFWSKFDKYRPEKIITNYAGDGTLQFNEAKTKLGNTYYKSVNINKTEIPIETKTLSGSLKNSFIPGYKLRTRDIPLTKNFARYYIETMKADEIGPITRAKVAREIRQKLGVSLTAWVIGKYSGKTEAEAKAQVERDAYEKANGGKTGQVADLANERQKNVASEVAQATDEAVTSEQGIKDIVDNPNEQPKGAVKVLQDKLNQAVISAADNAVVGAFRSIVSFINPIYAVAVPVCLVYDGSLSEAGPTIQNQTAQIQRSGLLTQSAAAELKDGTEATPQAAGAWDWKLGNISDANAEVRAGGGRVDTSSYQSVESSPLGSYSIADAGFGAAGLPGLGSATNSALNTFCPAATNLWLGAGLGVANIIATVFSGGSVGAVEAGGDAGAQVIAKTAVQRAVDKAVAKYVAASAAKKKVTAATGKFLGKTAVTAGAIVGATFIAQQIVQDSVAANHSSLATDDAYADDSDSGMNIYTNQISQRTNYGAPMSDSALQQDDSDNNAQLAYQESQKSTFDRYLAITNPNSLLSRSGTMVNGYLGDGFIKGLFKISGDILTPLHSFSNLLGSTFFGRSYAAKPVTSANTYYGNVQFGYTEEERGLMKQESYSPTNNRRALDQNGQEDEIDATYAPCFDGSKDISDLLTTEGKNQNGNDEHYIVRNDDGDVTGGICSQEYVGPHNKKYNDMVFRWRLANNYNNTLDQLIDQQDVTADRSTGDTGAAPVSGSAQELATQILANDKISLTGRLVKEDIEAASKDKNGSAEVKMSAAILGLILAVAKDHTVVVNALQSGGTGHCDNTPKSGCPNNGHYNGVAIDFGKLDGKTLTGRDSGSVAIIKIANGILPKGTGYGQSTCGGSVTLPDGFTEFKDSCDHLHIQVPKGTP
jgi:hypothetical protein